jgi:hypothetical protein
LSRKSSVRFILCGLSKQTISDFDRSRHGDWRAVFFLGRLEFPLLDGLEIVALKRGAA